MAQSAEVTAVHKNGEEVTLSLQINRVRLTAIHRGPGTPAVGQILTSVLRPAGDGPFVLREVASPVQDCLMPTTGGGYGIIGTLGDDGIFRSCGVEIEDDSLAADYGYLAGRKTALTTQGFEVFFAA